VSRLLTAEALDDRISEPMEFEAKGAISLSWCLSNRQRLNCESETWFAWPSDDEINDL
jgi:hypothetical protein